MRPYSSLSILFIDISASVVTKHPLNKEVFTSLQLRGQVFLDFLVSKRKCLP
jgi:hypothetical protein